MEPKITLTFNDQHYFKVRQERLRKGYPVKVLDYSDDIKDIRELVDYRVHVGDKVIITGNEPSDVLDIGTYVGNFGDEQKDYIPLVKSLDGKEYVSFGVLVKYSDALYSKLMSYHSLEWYNILAPVHAMVIEKYGIRYRSFRTVKVRSFKNLTDREIVNLSYRYEITNTAA